MTTNCCPQDELVPHVGDIGTPITLDSGVDLTGYSVTDILVTKPDGSEETWTGTDVDVVRDDLVAGNNRGVQYTTQTANDLDQAGKYHIRTHIENGSGGAWNGKIYCLIVES